MYDYRVISVAKVIDGDTYDLDLDLGFYASLRVRIRLSDVDTWEMWGKNAHELGVPAKNFAENWLQKAGELRVRTGKLSPGYPVGDGSFGRWVGEIYDASNGIKLSDDLRAANMEKTE